MHRTLVLLFTGFLVTACNAGKEKACDATFAAINPTKERPVMSMDARDARVAKLGKDIAAWKAIESSITNEDVAMRAKALADAAEALRTVLKKAKFVAKKKAQPSPAPSAPLTDRQLALKEAAEWGVKGLLYPHEQRLKNVKPVADAEEAMEQRRQELLDYCMP